MNPDFEQFKIQISKINVQHQTHKLQPKTKETHLPIDPEKGQIWTKTPLKFKQKNEK